MPVGEGFGGKKPGDDGGIPCPELTEGGPWDDIIGE